MTIDTGGGADSDRFLRDLPDSFLFLVDIHSFFSTQRHTLGDGQQNNDSIKGLVAYWEYRL